MPHQNSPKIRFEGLRPTIQHVVNELLDLVKDQDTFDLVKDLAFPLPCIVITHLLGYFKLLKGAVV